MLLGLIVAQRSPVHDVERFVGEFQPFFVLPKVETASRQLGQPTGPSSRCASGAIALQALPELIRALLPAIEEPEGLPSPL